MNWNAWSLEFEVEGAKVGQVLVTGSAPESAPRSPAVVHLVLDRSGSMTGAPLSAALEAAQLFVDQASAEDYVGLVLFDATVDARVGLTRMDAKGKEQLHAALGTVEAGSGTALHAAVAFAAAGLGRLLAPGRTSRLLLLTDGEPSVGPESVSAFERLAGELRGQGLQVHALGLGAHYVPEILAALTAPSSNGFEHVDGPEGLGLAMGALFAAIFGEAAHGLGVRATPVGFQEFACRHGYAAGSDGSALRIQLGSLSRGFARPLLFAGALAQPEWRVELTATWQDPAGVHQGAIEVRKVWPDSEEGARVLATGYELSLVTAESSAWTALAGRDRPRAEALLELASGFLRKLVSLPRVGVPVRRHLERLGDLRLAIDRGVGAPLAVRRARSTHSGTSISQVLDLVRPKD